MTTPTPSIDELAKAADLAKRLKETIREWGLDGFETRLRNPDGPEAADLILSLSSRVESAEAALKDAREALGREIASRQYEPMDASGTYSGKTGSF